MGDQVGKGGVLSGMLSRWRIRKALPYLSGRILDFGCGRGNLAPFVEPQHYVGLDRDEESIRIARKLHPKHTFVTALTDNDVFETIVALAVIEHITNPVTFLLSFDSLLSASGSIVLTTPHPKSQKIHTVGSRVGLFSNDAHEEHHDLYNYKDIEFIAKKSSLKVIKYEGFMMGLNQLIVMKTAT